MLARCGERNSSLTRTGTSTDARAAGVLLALHQWTRESGVSSETRARLSALAGQGRSGVLSLHTLNCSRLACSSPSLCCRIIRIFTFKALRDSRLFISDARVRTLARMGLRPLELESPLSDVRKVMKMIIFFCQISLFLTKIDADSPKFLRNLVRCPSGPRIVTSRDYFVDFLFKVFNLSAALVPRHRTRNLSQAPDLWSKVGCG